MWALFFEALFKAYFCHGWIRLYVSSLAEEEMGESIFPLNYNGLYYLTLWLTAVTASASSNKKGNAIV